MPSITQGVDVSDGFPTGGRDYSVPSSDGATFGQRFGAYVIDGLILGIPLTILSRASVTLYLLGLVGLVSYFVFLIGGRGFTVGQQILGIKVIDKMTGEAPGYSKATGRYFAHVLSAIPLGLGYWWMLWDDAKEMWHDKLSGTRTVRA